MKIKNFENFVNEGSETNPVVGSGTRIGFGDASGNYTSAAGVAVGGGDSPSSLSSNSNRVAVGKISSPWGPDTSKGDEIEDNNGPFSKDYQKSRDKKKKKKDKRARLHNQIGASIDKLYKSETLIKNWKAFTEMRLNEDEGGGGGTSVATLGNTSGMGAVVSAQPSSTPGSVWGADATKGSGDIGGTPLGPYTKLGAKRRRKRRKLGTGIDNFYVTNYKESTSNGKVIQSWKAFTDTNSISMNEGKKSDGTKICPRCHGTGKINIKVKSENDIANYFEP